MPTETRQPTLETVSNPPPEASEADRIRRVLGFHAQVQRGTIEMLVNAYLAGRELRPLYEQHIQAGDWVKYAEADLKPLTRKTADNYLALDAVFKNVEEVRALKLNLTAAYKLARMILRQGKPQRKPARSSKRSKRLIVRVLTCTKRLHGLVNELDRLAWVQDRDGIEECRQELMGTLGHLDAISGIRIVG